MKRLAHYVSSQMMIKPLLAETPDTNCHRKVNSDRVWLALKEFITFGN